MWSNVLPLDHERSPHGDAAAADDHNGIDYNVNNDDNDTSDNMTKKNYKQQSDSGHGKHSQKI